MRALVWIAFIAFAFTLAVASDQHAKQRRTIEELQRDTRQLRREIKQLQFDVLAIESKD